MFILRYCLVFLFVALLSQNGFAQNQQKYTYDFEIKELTDPCKQLIKDLNKIDEGDKLVIEVKNINRLLFDVAFNKEITNHNLNLPDLSALGIKGLTQSIIFADKGGPPKENATSNGDHLKAFVDKYKAVKKEVYKTQDLIGQLKDWYMLPDTVYQESSKNSLKKALGEFEDMYFEIIEDTSSISAFQWAEIQKLKQAIDDMDLLNHFEEAFILIDDLNALLESENPRKINRYVSPEIIASGDELKISIDISPREGVNYPFGKESIDLKFDVRKKTRISFSTGLFYSRLTGDSYLNRPNFNTNTLTGVDTVSSYTLVRDETENFNVGVAAYFHYSWPKLLKTAELGLTLGLGYDFEDRFQFLLGPSLIFGKKNRFIVSLGVAIGQVTELASGFEPGNNTAAPVVFSTRKKWAVDGFVGLSYNLNLGSK